MKKYLTILALIIPALCGTVKPAGAVPNLQLYAEGAIYDELTETWIINSLNFDLQVIGANLTINDVYLVAAVPTGVSGSVTIGSTTLSPYIYGTPVTGDGSLLPSHGIFPTDYAIYSLGDFGLVETVYDMIPGGTGGSAWGEIKIYSITISGFPWVHFDAYNHVALNERRTKYVFAPFSHDSEGTPEPASLVLLGSGLLGLAAFSRAKRKRS